MLLGHRKAIVLESEHVTRDGFADIRDGDLPGFALRNAAGQTWALGHPEAVLTGINNYLSHGRSIPGVTEKLNSKDFRVQQPFQFGGRVQPRIERTLRATTPNDKSKVSSALRSFQSFGC